VLNKKGIIWLPGFNIHYFFLNYSQTSYFLFGERMLFYLFYLLTKHKTLLIIDCYMFFYSVVLEIDYCFLMCHNLISRVYFFSFSFPYQVSIKAITKFKVQSFLLFCVLPFCKGIYFMFMFVLKWRLPNYMSISRRNYVLFSLYTR